MLTLAMLLAAATVPAQITDPIPAPIQGVNVPGGLRAVASGLVAPITGKGAPGSPTNHLFVIDQPGRVWRVDVNTGAKSLVLNVASRLIAGNLGERGLLGLAFHPSFAQNGRLYTYTSEPYRDGPDFTTLSAGAADHQSVIVEWRVDSPTSPTWTVNPASARELLRIDQPQSNHNGGCMAFGRDGQLYIALGDGGNANDLGAGHSPGGNAQNRGNVLGDILRINPLGTSAPNGQYSVPTDNPFYPAGSPSAGGAPGCLDGRCDEIFAYGFRNPYRFSFDRGSGLLIVADVGQNNIEEVNVVVAGGNYGWPRMEGAYCYDVNNSTLSLCIPLPAGLRPPSLQYDHDEGTAIIGGHVYRGPQPSALRGRYIFGDFARTFSNDGRIFAADRNGQIRELRFNGQSGIGYFLLGFAEDAVGNIYVLANDTGGASGTTGVILRPQSPIF